jgi:hypothetical protein
MVCWVFFICACTFSCFKSPIQINPPRQRPLFNFAAGAVRLLPERPILCSRLYIKQLDRKKGFA